MASWKCISFSLYNTNVTAFTEFGMKGGGSSVALDELTIDLLPPWPSKGTLILFKF